VVVEASSCLSTKLSLMHEAKKLPKRLYRSCKPTYVGYTLIYAVHLLYAFLQVTCIYGLYGIAISGMILGSNTVAPSTILHPHFFGPEPEFVDVLKNMLWSPQEVQQYLISSGL
jgi:hypothetical protein